MILKYITSILSSFFSICIVLKNSKYNLPITELRAMENDECIIIGNGPSFNSAIENNSKFFIGKRIICVNQFAYSEQFERIKPEYYLLLDPCYWESTSSKTIKELNCSLCEELKSKVTWRMIILMPVQAQEWNMFISATQQNKNIEICYFNKTPVTCFKSLRYFLYKQYLAMPHAQNVLVACIYVALNMRFKKIYLLGADHSWHENLYVDVNNILYWTNIHFYDHADPLLVPIYKDTAETDRFTMHELFAALSRMFEGYVSLEEYARYMGAKVYNATEKSYIDAYERYDIKS